VFHNKFAFLFSGDSAAEKLLISETRPIGGFQGYVAVLAEAELRKKI
jgi:hypothetical protein